MVLLSAPKAPTRSSKSLSLVTPDGLFAKLTWQPQCWLLLWTLQKFPLSNREKSSSRLLTRPQNITRVTVYGKVSSSADLNGSHPF